MNPVVIIPTFFASNRKRQGSNPVSQFDHATAISDEGTLERCLESLCKVKGVSQILILVAGDQSVAERAANNAHAIAQRFPALHTAVIGSTEVDLLKQRMDQLGLSALSYAVGLDGYGAVRNLGLVLTHALGFDSAVFIDDDEVVEDPEFLVKAMYGMGKMTRSGVPILAKTGYYLNADGDYRASGSTEWYDRHWQQIELFNEWIETAMAGKRISRTSRVCGGCLVLHSEAFKRVAFDPWITRGEDLDYMLNLRMYGADIWFDNQWGIRHLPPKTGNEGARFRQDVFRWMYEYRKLEFSRTQIDLLQIKPSTLQPYPGPLLEPGVEKRLRKTAQMRSLVRPNKAEYRSAAAAARGEADAYASMNCGKYFELQRAWPELMARMEGDAVLRNALVQSASQRRAAVREQMGLAPEVTSSMRPIADAPSGSDAGLYPGATGEINLNIQE